MKSPTPKQIKKARKKAGFTQENAAFLVNRSRRAWIYWESGDRQMPPEIWDVFKFYASDL